jgi:hypothetical protein
MLKVRIAAFMLGVLAPSAALAQPASGAGLPGIWEGTIGTLPVRACFVTRDYGSFGAYYYQSRLQMIALEEQEGARGTFLEGGGGGAGPGTAAARWRISQAGATGLTGQWTRGRRTLPVRLRLVARPQGEDSACASLAFQRPRLAGVQTIRTRVTYDGVDFTQLMLDPRNRFEIAVKTFALDGTSEPIRRINAALAEPLAGDPPHWFECVTNSMQMSAYEGDYSQELTPVMLSPRWLSVQDQQGGFCGGAHPDASSSYRLFDMNTGGEVDLHDWFNAQGFARERPEGATEDIVTLTPALRNEIIGTWRPQAEECGPVIREAEDWIVGLSRDGILFGPSLPHVVAACEEEWVIPFDRLRPYLTSEAQALVRALRAERP